MPTTYADANDFATYWGVNYSPEVEDEINKILVMAASNIKIALQAAGAANCSLADGAADYLENLNVVLAGSLYVRECGPHLTTDDRRLYLEWANNELKMIRDGSNELCAGETGKDFPSITWAEQGVDEFSAAKIIAKDL